MWAGCYTLDLYCDKVGGAGTFTVQKGGDLFDAAGHMHGEFPRQYNGESGAALRRKAREAGWIIKTDGTAICPKCSGKMKSSNSNSA